MSDTHTNVLIDICLNADKFKLYEINFSGIKTIGLNLLHFNKMLKSIKKKDAIEIFILNDNNSNFGIKILPRDNLRTTTSFIKIQNIQNIDFQIVEQYNRPIIISSSEYHKMIKDMLSIGTSGTSVKIERGQNHITFKCIAESLYTREVTFNNDNDVIPENEEIIYTSIFNIDLLNKFNKLSGFSKTINIYVNAEQPLMFKTNIGHLGEIKIFIKSIEQCRENTFKN